MASSPIGVQSAPSSAEGDLGNFSVSGDTSHTQCEQAHQEMGKMIIFLRLLSAGAAGYVVSAVLVHFVVGDANVTDTQHLINALFTFGLATIVVISAATALIVEAIKEFKKTKP